MAFRGNQRLNKPMNELQADCLAGFFATQAKNQLGITGEDYHQMAEAAKEGGDPPNVVSHGTAEQRRAAFLAGAGFYKEQCSPLDMAKIANLNDLTLRARYSQLLNQGRRTVSMSNSG